VNETKLRAWLQNPENYQEGIMLFEAAGGNEHQLELFKKFDAPFTREKLYTELEAIAETIKQPELKPEAPAPDYFDLPQVLKNAQKEKAQLYRECFPYRKELKEIYKKQLAKIITSKQRVTIAEACSLMNSTNRAGRNKPFSIAFVTYNRESGAAGQLVYYEHATLTHPNNSGSRSYSGTAAEKRATKDPRHWANSTRNILPLASRDPRKLHIWLLMMYDGMEVTLGDPG
jgi:hypothetical protein